MSFDLKSILLRANAAIAERDHEGFLSYCTDDTRWFFVGEQTLDGKDAVRAYMAATYIEPPIVMVDQLISEGDFLTVIGEITMKNADGIPVRYWYSDTWRFENGKMAELKAFVIPESTEQRSV
ncbi:MAG: nuclear transport factor 2 family protein [Chitinophagaceae bacterium]